MNLKFGENLRKYRLGAGLTQEQLAEIFGVSLQSVSRWESSHKASYPDVELLCSIARHFGVSVDELIGNNDGKIIDWGKYDRMDDPLDKYAFLIENKKADPDNHDIDYQLCCVATDLLDNEAVVGSGLASAKKLLKESKNLRYRRDASTVLLSLCPEDQVEDYINEYFHTRTASVYGRLKVRYYARGDHERLETIRKDHLIHLLEHLLLTDLTVDSEGKFDDISYIEGLRINIKLLDMICGIGESKYEIIGDGEVDLWSGARVRMGLETTKRCYRMGESEKADSILLEVIEFIEKIWNLPRGKVLTYRSEFIKGIEAEVDFYEYNNRKFITALHDSYFYDEKGLWFNPELLLDTLEEPLSKYPNNEVLASVYQRLKGLK